MLFTAFICFAFLLMILIFEIFPVSPKAAHLAQNEIMKKAMHDTSNPYSCEVNVSIAILLAPEFLAASNELITQAATKSSFVYST